MQRGRTRNAGRGNAGRGRGEGEGGERGEGGGGGKKERGGRRVKASWKGRRGDGGVVIDGGSCQVVVFVRRSHSVVVFGIGVGDVVVGLCSLLLLLLCTVLHWRL